MGLIKVCLFCLWLVMDVMIKIKINKGVIVFKVFINKLFNSFVDWVVEGEKFVIVILYMILMIICSIKLLFM